MKASHVILCLTVLAAAADNSSAQPTEQQLRSDWANLARFRDANTKLQPPLKNENRVVFMGNSITEGWLQYFPAMFPGKPYINRGIGGQTTPQMLVRFRPDVIALKPKVVVILAGTNDVAGNSGPVTPEVIQHNLATMAEMAKVHGIRVVLASILPVSDDKRDAAGQPVARTKDRPPATLRALNEWLADYARREGHVYLDYAKAVGDGAFVLKPELNDDGLHPNSAGYAVMAPLAEEAITRALGQH